MHRKGQNTLACGTTETMIIYSVGAPLIITICLRITIRQEFPKERQHTTANTHRSQQINEAMTCNYIKCCSEVKLDEIRLMPIIQGLLGLRYG